MENPFEELRPGMRSEHDEIRKGIFSRVLRNMQAAPLEERREWCTAIKATYAAKQKRQGRNTAVTTAAPSSETNTNACASTANSASASPQVGEKRPHATIEGEGDVSATSAVAENESGAPVTTAVPVSEVYSVLPQTAPVKRDTDTPAEELESEESVRECIAAYLRSLLDRVVGVSLEVLNVPALRILCTMVGIKTEVRNKIGLYSTLASFYYTQCEKLGKRVSRDTVFDKHVEQEMAMLKQAGPATAAPLSSSSSAAAAKRGSAGCNHSSTESEKKASASSSARASKAATVATASNVPAAVVVSVTSRRTVDTAAPRAERKTLNAPMPMTAASKTNLKAASASTTCHAATALPDVEHYLKYENYDDKDLDLDVDLDAPSARHHHYSSSNNSDSRHQPHPDPQGEVVYEDRVFTKRSEAAAASPHMSKYESSASDAWSMSMLERKVASIVQLHDPVTVAIVVKKLAQLGYKEGGAEAVVEQILRRFHDRQLIFYDNGIAYLM